MKSTTFMLLLSLLVGCAKIEYTKTVSKVDINKFFKKWYVIAGRFTFFEEGAHNAIEEYRWNKELSHIDIEFQFNKDSFSGELKKMNQTGWIQDKNSNAYWKISPFWPLKFDYLIIALADDYSWTVIGVPNQKYVWIMADDWKLSDTKLNEIIEHVKKLGYSVDDIVRVPHQYD